MPVADQRAHAALPPGPQLPRALQTAIWMRRAQGLLAWSRRRYGDTFTLRIAHEGTWVVTCNLEAVKSVFTGDPRILHAGEGNSVLLPVLGPNSVLLLDEEEHMRQRKLLLPPFHGARMKRYEALMQEIAAAEIERWRPGEVRQLRPRMQALTLEVILRAVFGVAEGQRLEELRRALRRLVAYATNPRAGIMLAVVGPARGERIRGFRERLRTVDELLFAEIAERRALAEIAEREDIMSLLLQARDEDGAPMSDKEVRDELLTLLLAGHETTANALAWAVERLARHPDATARLQEEVDAGESAYLQAVVQEILRLRPVISVVARRLKAPFRIGAWELPAGVGIVPSIYLMHRRADIYPEPERFRPERFLEQPPGTYTWIPFGGGVRRCLGAAFAQFEMEVVLRELIARRSLAPARAQSERVLRRAFTETPSRDAEVLIGSAERMRVAR
ncbi:MAG TPA: cytochrome P450 [Solirubrobacteraceae bacterium]|nr:cytochrome P450 [Solirubrobacteraceae bacterium]